MAKSKSDTKPPLGALLEHVFEMAPEYLVVLDADLGITAAGASFREATGVKKKQSLCFLDTVEKFSLSRVREVFEELRNGTKGHQILEINHRLPDGEAVTVAYTWVANHDDSGNCRAFVGIGREHPEDQPAGETSEETELLRKELETVKSKMVRRAKEISRLREEIKTQATRDEMTGLGNRRYLMDRLEFEASRAIRYDQPLTLILTDIDRMTQVNETYGQDRGDDVLREISEIVKQQIRASDMAGRYGGEEFLILCPHTDRANAQFLAERLRRRVAEISFTADDEEFGVTVSVGLVTVTGQNEFDVEAILHAAEQALESAKTAGMNRVRVLEVL
jgi:diguanylate cyclase (GGDEF)-like protein